MNIGKATQVVKQVAVNSVEKMDVTPQKLSAIAEDVVSFSKEVGERTLTKLSKNVDFRPTGKEFKYVSLPKGLDIVEGKITGEIDVPTVAILDIFSDFGNYKLGKKIKIPHGKIVSKIMTEGLEDKIGVLALDSTPKSKTEWVAMKEALEELVKLKKSGKNIKALNLSVGVETTFEELSERIGIDINNETITKKTDVILKHLKDSFRDKDKHTLSMIDAINSLVDDGVEIYLASGNNGANGLDLLSLSKAQNIVGADDYANATKCFANKSGKGVYKFKMIFDDAGNLKSAISDGLKFDSKDVTKISKFGDFISKFSKEKEAVIKGTSFSCPAKLNQDLKQIL